jgi:hypothetical protein
MNSINIQAQAAIAISVGLIAWIIGAAVWEWASLNWERWLGRAVVGAGVLQLAAFSHYASRQVERLNFLVDIKRQNANDTDERTTIKFKSDDGREYTVERTGRGQSASGIGYTTALQSSMGRDERSRASGRCCNQDSGGPNEGIHGMPGAWTGGALAVATPSTRRRVCECGGIESCDCIDCRCCDSFAAVSARTN